MRGLLLLSLNCHHISTDKFCQKFWPKAGQLYAAWYNFRQKNTLLYLSTWFIQQVFPMQLLWHRSNCIKKNAVQLCVFPCIQTEIRKLNTKTKYNSITAEFLLISINEKNDKPINALRLLHVPFCKLHGQLDYFSMFDGFICSFDVPPGCVFRNKTVSQLRRFCQQGTPKV